MHNVLRSFARNSQRGLASLRRWVTATGGLMVLALGSAGALAQPPELPTAQLAAIDRLAPMLGEWQGSGWIQMGPEGRSEFRQTESIREASGGTTVLVEGRGVADVDGREVVVHDALAVISFDAAEARYRFAAHTGRGEHRDSELTIVDDGSMVWGFDTPRGKVRFTIWIGEGTWREVGAFSSDGEQWLPFLEMNLIRK